MDTQDKLILASLLLLLGSIVGTVLLREQSAALALTPAIAALLWGLAMAPVPLPKVTWLLGIAAAVQTLFVVLVKVLP